MNNKSKILKISLLTVFLLFIMLIWGNISFAAEKLYIGKTKSYTFSDLSDNGVVPTKITSASSNNSHISIEKVKTGILFFKTISEIKVTGVSEGTSNLTISYEYEISQYDSITMTYKNITMTGFKQFEINVVDSKKEAEEKVEDLEFREEVETNKIEAWGEYYKKNISELDEPYEKLYYLKSILYQDSLNGNTELWNAFVEATTAEERKQWYRNITYNIRNVEDGIQDAIYALEKQIDVDEGTATEEELEKELEEARASTTKCV